MVTLAGTRNSRWPCWAGATAAATNWTAVMVPFGPAGVGQVDRVVVAPRT